MIRRVIIEIDDEAVARNSNARSRESAPERPTPAWSTRSRRHAPVAPTEPQPVTVTVCERITVGMSEALKTANTTRALEWIGRFERLGAAVDALPFEFDANVPAFFLSDSRQAFLPALTLSQRTLAAADELHRLVGPRPLVTWYDDPSLGAPWHDADVRTIIGLGAGRFVGFNGDALKVYSTIGLYRCGVCRSWWFLSEDGSWRCQVCGHYDGNADVVEQLTDCVPDDWTERVR